MAVNQSEGSGPFSHYDSQEEVDFGGQNLGRTFGSTPQVKTINRRNINYHSDNQTQAIKTPQNVLRQAGTQVARQEKRHDDEDDY